MIRTRALSAAIVAWLVISACAFGDSTPEPTDDSGGPTPTTGAAAQPTLMPASGGMNVDAVNLCQVLPPEEFAALAEGTLFPQHEQSGPVCTYTVDPGDGTVHTYVIYLYPPEGIATLVDYVRDFEEADWIEGMGDAAYVQPAVSGGGFDLTVLVEGEYALALNGPDPAVMQAAARLLLERIQP